MSKKAFERKKRFTASVRGNLVNRLDKKAAQLKVNRSDVVEEAIELWLHKKVAEEEEDYFVSAAKEMNEDARAWNAHTTVSSTRNWK